jgi:hypothetical protein
MSRDSVPVCKNYSTELIDGNAHSLALESDKGRHDRVVGVF